MRSDEPRTELEEERDFLLRSIEDLEREHAAGDLGDDDFRVLEDDYTARAAGVLRRLQHLDSPRPPPPPPSEEESEEEEAATGPVKPTGPVGRRRVRWPMILGIFATVALAAGSGYMVTQSSGERRPDQEVSGGPDRSPGSLLQQAIDLDNGGKLVDAAKLYDAVLAEEPENVIALTRRGWVLGRSGRQARSPELLQAGLGYLERATQVDPSYADAHAFKGLVLGALGRPGEAGCEFRLWLSIAPVADPLRPDIEGVLDEAIKQAGGTLPECPKPPVPVPVPAAPTPAAPATTTP
ncbi:MAG: hypothetical protein AVDCRST_MAG76-3231 [uncultured Acidimicrobiales bacterium]|uniref:Tetratricopeptide repeat protein n=1 Tax=uncultured Acidimicrobiales bacterium TaxID=310071 RepID=A0A6J4J6G3_9ACTN|nr:MAG: hypothetical protein AVDCRST_MAG76-3231 [uncultured Acidimicrobiales bacterium]